jgi:hypothetical protein
MWRPCKFTSSTAYIPFLIFSSTASALCSKCWKQQRMFHSPLIGIGSSAWVVQDSFVMRWRWSLRLAHRN